MARATLATVTMDSTHGTFFKPGTRASVPNRRARGRAMMATCWIWSAKALTSMDSGSSRSARASSAVVIWYGRASTRSMARSYNDPTPRGTAAAALGTDAAARGTAAGADRIQSIMTRRYPARSSPDTATKVGQPVVGLAPAGIGVLASGTGMGTGGRIRAEELHAALLGVEITQHVGQQLVGDVAVGVDDEAVVAQPPRLGRAALQARQIDAPGGKLLQDRDETPRLVGPLVHDQRGLVVTGWRGDAVA